LKTVKVIINRFENITDEVAIAEGEGDLSTDHWKEIHTEFFIPFLSVWGINDITKEDVITEFYAVVYK
jgi:uncharacterized protein YhfF